MLIPICPQFHYAYGDSPYANFSGSPHIRIWGLPVCVRGPASDVALTRQRFYAESHVNQIFLVASAHTQAHTNIKKQYWR